MDDIEIVDLFFQRDESALAAAAEKYGARLKAIAMGILGIEEDAEECVGDAYLTAWRSIPPERPDRLGAWLFRVVRNGAINRYNSNRAKKRFPGAEVMLSELSDSVPSIDNAREELDKRELAAFLDIWLGKLPRRERWIFLRRYWYGQRVGEMARELGEKPERVSKLLFNLRSKLKKALEKEGYSL